MEAHTERNDDKLGVHPYNSAISFNYNLNVSSPDNKELTSSVKLDYDQDIINIDESGKVTPKAAGTTTIKASIDGWEDSIIVNVHDFDILIENVNYAGKDFTLKYRSSHQINITTANSTQSVESLLNDLVFDWCFEANKTDKDRGMGLKIDGTGLNGSIERTGWNVEKPHATVLVSLKDGTQIGLIGFYAMYGL